MTETFQDRWHYNDPRQLYEAAGASGGPETRQPLHIIRLAPGDGAVSIDWIDFEPKNVSSAYTIVYQIRGQADTATRVALSEGNGTISIGGLVNHTDYELYAEAKTASGETFASPVRLFRPGTVPGTVINYIHPEDYTFGFSGRSPASPSIVRLPNGSLVASHDIYWGLAGQNTTAVFRSTDEGATWSFVTYLYPCFWGKLFVHRDRLYMIATSTEYGALLIGASDDGGDTWTNPVPIIPAGSREQGGPHKAPMPVIEHKGRLWTGIDYGSWTTGSHASGLVSVPAGADLLQKDNWTVMPFLPYNPEWPGVSVGPNRAGLLEGNAVVKPDGTLVNLLRYQTNGLTPSYGRAIMLAADADRPDQPLVFHKAIDFHGNLTKFTVYFDPVSEYYWSLVNRVKGPETAGQRNILALVRSRDLEQWDIVEDILNYADNDWPEDHKKVGFQYVDWIFSGDDILVASRTAINNAHNFHNANYLTFHTITGFRSR